MEKAILKTLAYADIFDYPLKAYEIHKWLIGTKATFQQVEKALLRLDKKSKVKSKKDYFFLNGKDKLVRKRHKREKESKRFLWRAKFSAWFLHFIPTIKLVGISGGLSLNNAESSDDIDLFLVTAKGRIWLSRFLIIFILDIMGVRRKAKMKANQAGGKICPNILLEENKLEQINKDLFVAHEVLQMKVLWQRDGIYKKYLEVNSWAFDFLPNWLDGSIKNQELRIKLKKRNSLFLLLNSIADIFETMTKWFQLWIMIKPQGMERIENGALYFHPNDIRLQVLKEYKTRLKTISP